MRRLAKAIAQDEEIVQHIARHNKKGSGTLSIAALELCEDPDTNPDVAKALADIVRSCMPAMNKCSEAELKEWLKICQKLEIIFENSGINPRQIFEIAEKGDLK